MNKLSKSWISTVLTCLLVITTLPAVPDFVYAAPILPESFTGSGEDWDPFQISDCETWVYISNQETTYFGFNYYFELTNNLDCRDDANDVIWGDEVPFNGSIDGNGYSITYDIDGAASKMGLFSTTSGAYLNDMEFFGTLDVTGAQDHAGGVIGLAEDDTSIFGSASHVTITADDTTNVGGMIGSALSDIEIENSYVDADILGGAKVGGLVGYVYGNPSGVSIDQSYAIGSVQGGDMVGGLVGLAEDYLYLDYSFAAIDVSSLGDYMGAILGYNDSIHSELSYNYYDIDASGLGTDSCFAFDGEGVEVIDLADHCEGIDTSLDADFFYDSTNPPFTVDSSDEWNQGEEYPYVYWYFSGDDYPVPMALVDLGAYSGAGSGTDEDPYIVTSCEEILEIDNSVDTLRASYLVDPPGSSTELDCTENGNDIMIRTDIGPFRGTFDGGETLIIIDVDFTEVGERHTGFIGRADGATIIDTYIEGGVSGNYQTGGLLGYGEEVTITNSGSSALITGTSDQTGGLIGYCEYCVISESFAVNNVSSTETDTGGLIGQFYGGTISDSYATGDIDGTYNVGGFIGYSIGNYIESSYATGNVVGDGDYIGGFIGYDEDGDEDTTIEYSYATGDVTNHGDESTGGLIGYAGYTEVYYSYATGDVDTDVAGYYFGGLVGYADSAEFYEVFATGDVTGTNHVGGLVGYYYESYIYDAYARGSITGENYVGGLIGQLEYEEVVNTYSTGLITGVSDVGGLIGDEYEADTDYSFWDTETSGTEDSDSDEVGKTTTEMKTLATYTTDLGEDSWDFEEIWTIDESNIDPANDGYPYFDWQDLELGTTGGGNRQPGNTPQGVTTTTRYFNGHGGGGGNTDNSEDGGEEDTSSDDGSMTYDQEVKRVMDEDVVKETPDAAANKCEVLMMMSRVFEWQVPEATTSNYTDLPDWCVSLAAFGTTRGIVEGRTPTALGLETPVTRFEVAVMVYRELKLQNYEFTGTDTKTFSDEIVPWAQEAVAALAKEGILKGFPNGTFAGPQGILKQDLGVILLRVKDNL